MSERENDSAVCGLCPHHCHIAESETGLCAARTNRGGKIVCQNYGQITSLALDPIEKKPLYHFRPGSVILSTFPRQISKQSLYISALRGKPVRQ